MPNTSQTTVDIKKCEAEAEMVGFLLGRKLVMRDPNYVPSDLGKYHTLPLQQLNRVAVKAYHELQK